MISQIFLSPIIRNWLTLNCVYRSSRVISYAHPSCSHLARVPWPNARKQGQIVIQPIFMLPSTICWLYLEDLLFKSVSWLPCPLAPSEACQGSSVGSHYQGCQVVKSRFSSENQNVCVLSQMCYHIGCLQNPQRCHSLFIFWEEKNHLWLPFHPRCAVTSRRSAFQRRSNYSASSLAGGPDGIACLFRSAENYTNFEKIRWRQALLWKSHSGYWVHLT